MIKTPKLQLPGSFEGALHLSHNSIFKELPDADHPVKSSGFRLLLAVPSGDEKIRGPIHSFSLGLSDLVLAGDNLSYRLELSNGFFSVFFSIESTVLPSVKTFVSRSARQFFPKSAETILDTKNYARVFSKIFAGFFPWKFHTRNPSK